jgi:outer membrane biosynthesis protein TonB
MFIERRAPGLVRRLVLVLLAISLISCTSAAPDAMVQLGPCAAEAEPTALTMAEGSGIVAPKVIHRVEPNARSMAGRRATAIVEAVIGEDGVPRHICVATGDPEWGRIVADALRYWRFEPGTLNGKPVAVRFSLTSQWDGG